MITYELAKQLKDAGFSQYWDHDYYNEFGMIFRKDSSRKIIGNETFIPTLSELIEACGPYKEAPENLSPFSPVKGMAAEFNLHASLENGKVLWHASYFYPHHAYDVDIITSGDTPEIAVAKLYLAINKK